MLAARPLNCDKRTFDRVAADCRSVPQGDSPSRLTRSLQMFGRGFKVEVRVRCEDGDHTDP
jgi:hypothetical protein